jgi:hypothetical protein
MIIKIRAVPLNTYNNELWWPMNELFSFAAGVFVPRFNHIILLIVLIRPKLLCPPRACTIKHYRFVIYGESTNLLV